ncbi:hypothetical protein SAMN04488003_1287 [Loktanella fryxellensis]|uniref:Uncharacterized protein n=2 Tax=Loktanella fryxellensis TaxID=245187 RepID=A0A1H8ISP8_9RHOB|nr:hypothetical protein SAMN04488003_1287 [Loktanella fryxellensis]
MMRPDAPLLQGQSAFYMLHPSLAGRVDFPDMAGLAANRPLFLRSGHGDRHMPVDSVQRAFGRLAKLAKGTDGSVVDAAFHDAGHTMPAEVTQAALRFLMHHLR